MNKLGVIMGLILIISFSTACTLFIGDNVNYYSAQEKGSSGMIYNLNVKETKEQVYLELKVKNAGQQPKKYVFNSGQEFDFSVEKKDEVVWRWSYDKVFTQVLKQRELGAGETIDNYQAVWPKTNLIDKPVNSGRFLIKAYFLGYSKTQPVAQIEIKLDMGTILKRTE